MIPTPDEKLMKYIECLQKYGALFNNLRGEFDAHATTMARDKLKTLKRSPPPGPCKLH